MGILETITDIIKGIPESAVLREHVAMLRDQFTAMERKTKDLEAKVSVLEAEKARLELDNAELREQVRNLQEQLTTRSGHRLEPLEERLLQFMEPLNSHMPSSFFAHALKEKGTRIEVHLDTLRRAGLVRPSMGTGTLPAWGITIEGKRYVVEHGLLK
ncbi:MAG: hypothetical protein HYZ50_23065 [Deltaproteobacteria bacterium]|nr:hypothetical protein [Deltaproteobacteria bacterium]